MRCDVAVVGGGIAGLAAAERIAQAGRSVVLLEARNRLGGRIHTLIDPVHNHPVELGAEFLQGQPRELLQLLEGAGLALREIPERHEGAPRAGQRRLPDVDAVVDRLLSSARSPSRDVPVAQLIREQAGNLSPEELNAATNYLEGFHGADLERFGTAALEENQAAEAVDGEHMFRLAGGYGAVVTWLAARLESSSARVRTGTVVTRLRWTPGAVQVAARMPGGDAVTVSASHAVLAVPISALKAGNEEEGSVALQPVPPSWDEALRTLETGAAQRLDLRFESAWWMQSGRAAPIFVHGRLEPFPVWWTTSPPTLPFLTGWVGGPRAFALSGKSQDELVALGLRSLSNIFGVPLAMLHGSLQAAYSHDWMADPFSRGAYTYGGVGAKGAREHLRRPVAGTVFLSGEAIGAGGRNATVPGAFASGIRAAQDLLGEPVAGRRRLSVD